MSKGAMEVIKNHGIRIIHLSDGDLNQLREVPKFAYVLVDHKKDPIAIYHLIEKGVEQILFHPLLTPHKKILAECEKRGAKTLIGCPMMFFDDEICKFKKVHALFCSNIHTR